MRAAFRQSKRSKGRPVEIYSQGMHFSRLELLLRAANRLAGEICGAGKLQLTHDPTPAGVRRAGSSPRHCIPRANVSPRRTITPRINRQLAARISERAQGWKTNLTPPPRHFKVHLMPFFRLRRPTYRLKTLLLAILALSVALAFLASREHRYRVRTLGVPRTSGGRRLRQCSKRRTWLRNRRPAVGVGGRLETRRCCHRRENVGGTSDRSLSALLCFPTVTALGVGECGVTDAQARRDWQVRAD